MPAAAIIPNPIGPVKKLSTIGTTVRIPVANAPLAAELEITLA